MAVLQTATAADAQAILELRLANHRLIERIEWVDHLLWERIADDDEPPT